MRTIEGKLHQYKYGILDCIDMLMNNYHGSSEDSCTDIAEAYIFLELKLNNWKTGRGSTYEVLLKSMIREVLSCWEKEVSMIRKYYDI